MNKSVIIKCISDTHGSHYEIDSEDLVCDILIHAGDWSSIGSFQGMMDLNEWFKDLPADNIICIARKSR
jgi:predicted phosphodiesterase